MQKAGCAVSDNPRYTHVTADLADRAAVEAVFAGHKPQRVINLAAQAGVRYAAQNPHVYVSSNVTGFLHVLEGCRHHDVEHLVFASTSSVYGANTDMPFSEHQSAEHPLTLYAATKKANEMMAHSYAHLYGIPSTGLRFFTVYGPWGRPDMALFLFTKASGCNRPFVHHGPISAASPTDAIVEGVAPSIGARQGSGLDTRAPDPATTPWPLSLYNIVNEQPWELLRYIECWSMPGEGPMNCCAAAGDVPIPIRLPPERQRANRPRCRWRGVANFVRGTGNTPGMIAAAGGDPVSRAVFPRGLSVMLGSRCPPTASAATVGLALLGLLVP